MTTEPSSGTRILSRDRAFEILTNARRRYTLSYLRSQSGAVSIGELAEAVAAWENDTSVELVSSKERKSVYTSLYQTHLPKMADAGIIEYDRQRGNVQLNERATELDEYLYPAPGTSNWSAYYLGLSLVGGVAILCRLIGMYPFTEIPVLVYAGLLLGSFMLLSAVNLELVRRDKNGRRERRKTEKQ
ncbi:hypothetical protein ACFFQF_10325 [Haladaptatus pallidirubidus]|uniref:DUF7344 domain-containing protein n=1 Tax=Haladaptatus pallidirubidus TaxID=1008152 RepID=A0AAV3UF29_9EURY|nr:hypothetical protein [Haladaptatus pallidirubidus]